VLALPDSTVILHVGDGAAVTRVKNGGWECLSWPANGEYAAMTYFVTDDPFPDLKIARSDQPVEAVAVFSDGIERLVLDFKTRLPHAPFFDRVIERVGQSQTRGESHDLNQWLEAYLNSDPVNARTDDDKGLILGIRK
jgi:hypothetical protein